jgi:hypothetical protein
LEESFLAFLLAEQVGAIPYQNFKAVFFFCDEEREDFTIASLETSQYWSPEASGLSDFSAVNICSLQDCFGKLKSYFPYSKNQYHNAIYFC